MDDDELNNGGVGVVTHFNGGVVTEMHDSEVQLSDHELQPASKLVKKQPVPQPTVAFNAVTESPTPGGCHPFLLPFPDKTENRKK